ncbi:MAG: mechanosensitive ion channel family protein [Bryobacteraceae bacterium]
MAGVSAPRVFQQISWLRVFQAALVLFLAWLLIRWTARSLEYLSARVPRARFFFKRLEPVLRIGLWFTALLLLFSLLAPSRETFLASLASFGLALGLGAQDLVKNLIGGLVILADRPYQLGDRVRIGDAYGEIDHIGLRSTKLTTPEGTRITIPNSEILGRQVFNANSGVPDCQVVTDLYSLLGRKPVEVHFLDGFTEMPHVIVRIKAYVFDHRYENRMKSDIVIRAKTEFIRRGWLEGWGRLPARLSPPGIPAA